MANILPESVDCSDPNELMQASDCYKCIPTGMQQEVIIYLLNTILGGGATPQQLMEAAACYRCIPPGQQAEVQTYLLCAIAQAHDT